MMELLFEMHLTFLRALPRASFARYLIHQIDWTERGILITGPRGVGKTVMVHQYFLNQALYRPVTDYLYVLADSLPVVQMGLYKVVADYFQNYGGKAVFIDEVQKYDHWQQELKTIFDVFGHKQIVVSGSSSLLLNETDSDIKRRRAAYELPVLSFREYLDLAYDCQIAPFRLEDLLDRYMELAMTVHDKIHNSPTIENSAVMRLYKEYLKQGQFAFCLDAKSTYLTRLNETINAVIEQDICKLFSLPPSSIEALKKLYIVCVISEPFMPNYLSLSRELGISKDSVKKYFTYLEKAGLIRILRHAPHKISDIISDKGKILAANTNDLYAICTEPKVGTIREVEFACATARYHPYLDSQADFVIGERVFEVGGPNKGRKQIRHKAEAFIVRDDAGMPSKGVIPLYLFGFLY